MIGQRHQAARFFCAVCGDDIASSAPRQAPLGKRGALVNVCDDCLDEPAREKRGRELGYQGSDPDVDSISSKAARARIDAAGRELGVKRLRDNPTVTAPTLGWIVVRVPRRDDRGQARDRAAALATLDGEPWCGELRYLGIDSRYVLFERPPRVRLGGVVAGFRGNYPPSENPLAALERWRVEPGARPARPARKARRK